MAVFKQTCSNTEIVIYNVDHSPPHCHVFPKSGERLVAIHSLTVIRPKGAKIPSGLRKCLKKFQVEMLAAWEKVHVDDTLRHDD